MLMSDEDILELAKQHPDLLEPVDLQNQTLDKSSLVQPASLDMTVGAIYLPEVPDEQPGSITKPRTDAFHIKPGTTVIVSTAERINLPANVAAMGFPPARVSRDGLLMTNPGHVDPGYSGNLTFTLINMGRETYELTSGQPIVSLMLFSLKKSAKQSWDMRHGSSAPGSPPVKQITLDKLSKDFLRIDARATQIAEDAESQARRSGLFWTFVTGVVALVFPFVGNAIVSQVSDVEEIEGRVSAIEAQIEDLKLDSRLRDVEQMISESESEG